MHKIVIIEDESPARKKLKRFLEKKAAGQYKIIAELETVAEVKNYFEEEHAIDLVFSDIELRDGNVFEVYAEMAIKCPIIFATAYDKFLMNAFEVNGIEYLLKPYSYHRFEKAWEKFTNLRENLTVDYAQLIGQLNQLTQPVQYKDQIAIKSSKGIYFLSISDVVSFRSDGGLIYVYDRWNKKHVMPQSTLKEIEEGLDPQQFYRINRSDCIHRKYIDKLERYDKNSYSVYLNNEGQVLKTSQSITPHFSAWLGV